MAKACWSYVRKPHPPVGWPAGTRVPKIAALERYHGSYVYLRQWDQAASAYVYRHLGFKVRNADGSLNPDRVLEAEQTVLDASFEFREGRTPDTVTRETATLGSILERYLRERTPHKSTADGRARDRQIADLFIRVFGAETHPRIVLDPHELQTRIVAPRHKGTISPRGEPVSPGEREIVGYSTCLLDLRTFAAMMRWATKAKGPDGRTLLDARELLTRGEWDDTLAAVFKSGEREPDRPSYSPTEIEKLIAAAPAVHAFMGPLIVLAVETGRRASALLNLQRRDVDLEPREFRESVAVTFRGEHDKMGRTSRVPVTEAAEVALRQQLAAIPEEPDAFLFPSPRPGRGPMTYSWAILMLRAVEESAGVESIKGRGLHAFRRAFATELRGRGVPTPVVEELGGWSPGSNTLKTIYTQLDRRPDLLERHTRNVDEVRREVYTHR